VNVSVGYARARGDANLATQESRLSAAGATRIIVDRSPAGPPETWPGLVQLLRTIDRDTVLVASIDRLGRTQAELNAAVGWILSSGSTVRIAGELGSLVQADKLLTLLLALPRPTAGPNRS
jgi:DNA invertase Pin-like site-specific DNA recombinase